MFGLNKLQIYGLISVSFFLGLLGVYSAGVSRGQDKVKRKIDEKRIQNFKTQKEVEDDISELDDTSLSDRATEWVRKD